MAEQIAQDKIRGLIQGFKAEERAEALKYFSDAELMEQIGSRLAARANSLDAVMEALGNR